LIKLIIVILDFADIYDFNDENYANNAVCTADNKREIVNVNYKKKSVEFWKSGKK
jgi:hypothetical protein